jgi:hypothetical protein
LKGIIREVNLCRGTSAARVECTLP